MGHIAIIESTGVMRSRIQRLLLEMGIENVEINKNKYQDKIQLTHFYETVDLILLDIDNEDIDSTMFIDELKKEPFTSEIPIIVISSHADITTLKTVIAKGCNDFLMKPFDNDIFVSKIEKWFSSYEKKIDYTASTLDSEKRDINDIRLVWSDTFKLGIEQIDEEHKSLFDSFQHLYTLMHEGKGHTYYHELVTFLENYVNDHFSHEEIFQKSISYDVLDHHIELHEAFKTQVQEIIETHKDKEVTNMDLIEISLFIQDWLIHHVLMEDGRLARFVAANEK